MKTYLLTTQKLEDWCNLTDSNAHTYVRRKIAEWAESECLANGDRYAAGFYAQAKEAFMVIEEEQSRRNNLTYTMQQLRVCLTEMMFVKITEDFGVTISEDIENCL